MVNSSLPEFFGSGTSTSPIGNQASFDLNDPNNIYYTPAFLGFAKKVSATATAYVIDTDFKDINGIVKSNSTTGETGTTTTTGSANTNYQSVNSAGVSIVLPIRFETAGALGISYFGPIGTVTETDSGDPVLPEYVMYRSRYKRSQIHVNYGHALNDNWALSFGTHIGFQASARVSTNVSLGDSFGSRGASQTKISPSLGLIFSLVRKDDDSRYYFTFQQEMKSNLETIATGDISDPPLTLINIGIDSMMYYDPHTFRFGSSFHFENFEFYGSFEYQLWDKYKSPILLVSNKGGTVRGSSNYEKLKTKNIFIPKLGVKYMPHYRWGLMAGAFYRPTPIDSDFSGAGNSIDTDVLGLTSGLTYDFRMFKYDFQIGFSGQYHMLSDQKVTKTTGQENGNTGSKIGAPGYDVGGSVIVMQSGIKVGF
tara:strand:- start:106912 stop:108183 length:1272 start_codon:yes stop_codon:yes gene_type:complete